jgi:hypothetical protein
MDSVTKLEIHFHEQEKASVYLETNCKGLDEKIGEIGILVLFAIRIMSNLGRNAVSDGLATLLVDAPKWLRGIAAGEMRGDVSVIPYPGYVGRKRFIAEFKMNDKAYQFKYKAKGFGWFSSGIGYYSPNAVLVFLRFLAAKRLADNRYLEIMLDSAAMAGRAQLAREISVTNHYVLATAIISRALSH